MPDFVFFRISYSVQLKIENKANKFYYDIWNQIFHKKIISTQTKKFVHGLVIVEEDDIVVVGLVLWLSLSVSSTSSFPSFLISFFVAMVVVKYV